MIKINTIKQTAGATYEVFITNDEGLEQLVIVMANLDESEIRAKVQEQIDLGVYNNANFKKWTPSKE